MKRPGSLIAIWLVLTLLISVPACDIDGGGTGSAFTEAWESTPVKTYQPSSTGVTAIQGDEGYWIMGDTVSNFSDCGATPHAAEIFNHNGSKALKLTSNDSDSSCADNVWVSLFDTSKVSPLSYNVGFSVPLRSSTRISFSEEGAFTDISQRTYARETMATRHFYSNAVSRIHPQGWDTPPGFDKISLTLTDNRGNSLAYVLQYFENDEPNEQFSFYKEIFLDQDAGFYERSLFDDFMSIPAFNPANASIVSIDFKVHEHGWAIIDDIKIVSAGSGGHDGSTTTTTASKPGGTCVNVPQGPWTFCLNNEDTNPGHCFLEFEGGKLSQEGCYISYNSDGIFSGALTGKHWEGENIAGHFKFTGDFTGASYTKFEGVFTLTDGSGVSRRMTGEYDSGK